MQLASLAFTLKARRIEVCRCISFIAGCQTFTGGANLSLAVAFKGPNGISTP